MDALLAKLTNLGYELFGVFLPGIIAALFLILWWGALGPVAPLWSCGFFPQLTSGNVSEIIDSLTVETGVGIAVPSLAIAYFLGHILLWIARSGEPDPTAAKDSWRRIGKSLAFRIPKPFSSYDEVLQPLYDSVQKQFSTDGVPLPWAQFYPVVKSYLAKNLTNSLVATYQNKYTLHRSITTAATGLFWICAVSAAAGVVSLFIAGVAPRWGILATLAILALILIWGFSGSYMYHWKMFGNTIVTEAYSLISGPVDEKSK